VFKDFSKSFSDISPASFEGESLLVRLIGCNNMPRADMTSASDVYVKAELIEPPSTEPIATARWPVKWDQDNPIWDSARLFGDKPPKKEALLRLHFYDQDELDADDYLGSTQITVGKLGGERVLPIKLHKRFKASRRGAPTCTLRREHAGLERAAGGKKVVFLVRHGESVWNKAQDEKRLDVMLSDVDHPLNATGRQQAETLRDALRAGGSQAHDLLSADAVMCSPLTRAVQTCLIGLEPMLLRGGTYTSSTTATCEPDAPPIAAPQPVTLNPNLREKRNVGGKDSSGKWVGEKITTGVHAELTKLLGDEPERAAALKTVPLDLAYVHTRWWLGSKESSDGVRERVEELLHQVRFDPAPSQVLVGHSHYFREMFRHFAAPDCTLTDGAGHPLPADQMGSKKLSNAGVARCELDFGSHPKAPLVAVQLLFHTQLVS